MTKASVRFTFALSVLFFCSSLFAQSSLPSRPESFEWDHQIKLWDEAFYSQNYAEAESYGRRSLEIVEQLHLDDIKRATSLSSTAESLRYQNKYDEAERMYRAALAIREKQLPPLHPRTAMTLQGLGATLVHLNRPTEAEPMYLRSIAIWDRVSPDLHDPCHHGTALDGLGRLYFQTKEYERAEPLYQRALEVWKKGDQPCTLIVAVMNDLAALDWAQGKLGQCEQMYNQTIPLLQRELGDEQPALVAEQKAKLARVYMAQQKNPQAVALLQEVTPVLQRSGPSEHDLLLQSLTNELALLRVLHRDSEIPKVQGQLDAIQGIRSQSNEAITRWRGEMAVLNHTNDPAQRAALLQQMLADAEKLSPGPELEQTLEMLAASAQMARRNDQAETYLRRALTVNEQAFGNNSSEAAHTLDNLAIVLSEEKKDSEAIQLMRREVSIFENADGLQVQLSVAEQHLADAYKAAKKSVDAEAMYVRSLHALESAPEQNDLLMTGALVRLAMFYKGWGKYEQAVPYYVRAVHMKEARTSFDPSLLADLESLSDLLRQLNRTDEAKKYDARRKELIDQQISRGAQSATK